MRYPTELISSETIAEGTMAFRWKRPEGFAWTAGQSMDLALVAPPETDAEGNTRAYSIAAAPSSSEIVIATRMRDTAFKRTLKSAKPGMKAEIEGPFGSFTLHEKASRPAIMLVGGIGITPFRSILLDAAERKLPHKIWLFYSNRRPEDAAFLDELQSLAARNPSFTFVPTMTDMEKSSKPWNGERGYIDLPMLERHAPKREGAVYYSAGPQAMVAAMRKIVEEAGASADDFKTEEFSGY